MKKILLLSLIIMACTLSYAQENVNRMIVHEASGYTKGFLVERVDSVTFPQVEGRVAADVEITEVSLEKVKLAITRTPACEGFKLACLTKLIADRLGSDASVSAYIDGQYSNVYYEDFTTGELTGAELQPNSQYALVTVGLDKYGIPCGVVKTEFTTPKKPLVGDPKVVTVIDETKGREFTATFTPNRDVNGYAVVAGEKGVMQSQYEQWGPMMGFQNFGDLVKAWGVNFVVEGSHTWTEMEPNTDYEIFVQAWDANDTYAECDVVDVTTAKLGGTGAATVAITLGDYKLQDWNGEQLPSQFISFTPNDQSSCYRLGVYLTEIYDADAAAIESEVKMDPPMPMANWFQYDALTTDFQINPGTSVVAIAASKNADGVWGESTILRFTTPDTVAGAKTSVMKASDKIVKRESHRSRINIEPGTVPQMLNISKEGIKLIEK